MPLAQIKQQISSCSKSRPLLVACLVIAIIAVIIVCVLAVLYAKEINDKKNTPTPDNEDAEGCPYGWKKYMSSCYGFVVLPSTWKDAKANCSNLQAYLVEIQDSSENSFLQNYLNGIPVPGEVRDLKNQFWIGNSDMYTEGNWVWAWSETHCEFTDWAGISNEPNGERRENCGSLKASLEYHWNDSDCSLRLNFICEKQVS